MTGPHVEYVAHHWILLAVPAFLPAIVVVAVILYVALKDRRSGGKGDIKADIKADTADQRSGATEEKSD